MSNCEYTVHVVNEEDELIRTSPFLRAIAIVGLIGSIVFYGVMLLLVALVVVAFFVGLGVVIF